MSETATISLSYKRFSLVTIFRRPFVAVIFLIFVNRLNHLSGTETIRPGDAGYYFGALTSSVVTQGYFLVASLFWLVAFVISAATCLAFEPPHIKRPGFMILGSLVVLLALLFMF